MCQTNLYHRRKTDPVTAGEDTVHRRRIKTKAKICKGLRFCVGNKIYSIPYRASYFVPGRFWRIWWIHPFLQIILLQFILFFNSDRPSFYAEIQIIFGTVYTMISVRLHIWRTLLWLLLGLGHIFISFVNGGNMFYLFYPEKEREKLGSMKKASLALISSLSADFPFKFSSLWYEFNYVAVGERKITEQKVEE